MGEAIGASFAYGVLHANCLLDSSQPCFLVSSHFPCWVAPNLLFLATLFLQHLLIFILLLPRFFVAGFAEGSGRPATLLIGDLSFLHDINGLNLLRTGEMRPPLTVVLINNAGGGIFSFLPIADAVPQEVFTALWATPQNVDLEGMCRAQGIAHQKVRCWAGRAVFAVLGCVRLKRPRGAVGRVGAGVMRNT